MFFIMGPLWIFEIIEWQLKLTGNYDLNVSKGLLIFHICNSLQVISDFLLGTYVSNLLFDFRDSLCFAQYAETKLQTFLVQYLVIWTPNQDRVSILSRQRQVKLPQWQQPQFDQEQFDLKMHPFIQWCPEANGTFTTLQNTHQNYWFRRNENYSICLLTFSFPNSLRNSLFITTFMFFINWAIRNQSPWDILCLSNPIFLMIFLS